MLEGPSNNKKRTAQQNLNSEELPKKKVKSGGKTVIKYSEYLEKYISRENTVQTTLTLPKEKMKSLVELSIEAVVANPEIIKAYLPSEASSQILEAGAALLFAPKLTEKDWKEQLEVLKKHNAQICGVEVVRFEKVVVVDLSSVEPDEVRRLIRRSPEELIVVHGACSRRSHLPISKGVTVIGRNAVVTVENKSFKLNIPKATITANPQEMDLVPNEWVIAKSETEVNTNSDQFQAGYYPLVYLNASNLFGVELDCQGVTQGVVGSRGNICIANNKIFNTRECGIFVHDCESANISGNELHTKESNDKISISSAKCTICRQNDNSISYA